MPRSVAHAFRPAGPIAEGVLRPKVIGLAAVA
jgi:hypothetical protein